MIGATAAALTSVLVLVLGAGARRRLVVRSRRPAVGSHRWRRRRARRPTAIDHARFLDALAGEVRSGCSLGTALVVVARRHPCTPEMRNAADRVAAGQPLALAIEPAAGRDAAEAVMVQALLCAAAVGGPAAATLDAAAAVLRQRDAVAAEARTHSAQARLSAQVLTVVPVVFAAWTAASSERARHAIVSSPVGTTCLLAGLALNAGGWWWMHRIVGAVR